MSGRVERDGSALNELLVQLWYVRDRANLKIPETNEEANKRGLKPMPRDRGVGISRTTFTDTFSGRKFPSWWTVSALLSAYENVHPPRSPITWWDHWRDLHEQMSLAHYSTPPRTVPRWERGLDGPQPEVATPSLLPPASDAELDVERYRWNRLSPETQASLFARFQRLTPSPTTPLYWTVAPELQLRLDAALPIDFEPVNRILAGFGFAEECGLPISQDSHLRIQALEKPLLARLEPHFVRGERVPDVAYRAAFIEMVEWLREPRTPLSDDTEPWDVIIVPGNRTDLELRVQRSVELLEASTAPMPKLVFSGAHPRYEEGHAGQVSLPIGEAEAMAHFFGGKTTRAEYVLEIDSRAVTTEETFYNCIRHVRETQVWKHEHNYFTPPKVIVATSPYHVRRAQLLANRILGDDRTPLASTVYVAECAAKFEAEFILDAAGESRRDRSYGASVYIQEMLKIVGGRAAGVF